MKWETIFKFGDTIREVAKMTLMFYIWLTALAYWIQYTPPSPIVGNILFYLGVGYVVVMILTSPGVKKLCKVRT